jgi:hypothetical protein
MTTQIIYKQELELTPPLPNYYSDDSTFSHLIVIPNEYHTLSIGTTNTLEYIQTNSSGIVGEQTIDLTGTLLLTSSSVNLGSVISPQSAIYIAEYFTNTALFEYVDNPFDTKQVLSVGDSILAGTITKLVHHFQNYNYLEFSGSVSFSYDQIINIGDIAIKIKAGKGIFTTAGVVGVFSTDFKTISYYANFTPTIAPNTTNSSISPLSAFSHTDNIYSQFVSNSAISSDISYSQFNTDLINSSISNLSSIPSINIPPSSNIDGTSANSITITSWLDIPHKTDDINFGISNFATKNFDLTYAQSFDMSITINFNWHYTPVPITSFTPTLGSQLIDNWLIHTYTTNGVDDMPTNITYELDGQGRPSYISYTNQIDPNTKSQYVLFAGNGVIYRTGTHTLDYNTEPPGSSTDTFYQGVQNKVSIPCLYSFDPNRIKQVNDSNTNLSTLPRYNTSFTSEIGAGDAVFNVVSTTEFLNVGYLQIFKYLMQNSGVNRTYSIVGYEIVSYTHKDDTHFYGVSRSLFGTAYDYPKLSTINNSEWYYQVSSHYPNK